MKIINATWELRNLGVETVEVELEAQDTEAEIEAALADIHAGYCVVKCPAERAELILPIQQAGFQFIEDMVLLSSRLQPIERNRRMQMLYDEVTTERMNDADMAELNTQIRCGLFSSDRIDMDAHFTHEQAQQRYINWVADEYRRGTLFFKYVYRGQTIGFFALREVSAGKYTSFLGGIYPAYRKAGIGSIMKVPETVRSLGGTKISTSVSTNNPSQIRNLIAHGYIPERITHVFIRHNAD